MIPVALATERLVLDQPTIADVTLITEYCGDPVFEHYMNTPWPYERKHAVHFVEQYVPIGWEDDREYTWALRSGDDFLGVIGYREATHDIGYWLGAPHRGSGYMTEAAGAVVDWLFSVGRDHLAWECIPGNLASAAVARKIGFSFTGEGPSALTSRDDTVATAWHASLAATDDRAPKPGWPLP
ncbi:MAG: GNAT family N-acetyltransferase [Actinobacteria bacterium]|nr:GNAT family N-acetyltransferase [Actinomycetota bacterium]